MLKRWFAVAAIAIALAVILATPALAFPDVPAGHPYVERPGFDGGSVSGMLMLPRGRRP
jgi:hypothetical protein